MNPPSTLIRQARLVPIGTPAAGGGEPVDLRITDGIVTEVGTGLRSASDELMIEAAGRWAIPGLWDQHVHMGQWARTRIQVDLSGSTSPDEVIARILQHLRTLPSDSTAAVFGFGFRAAGWARQPTVEELDLAVADRPVVLISGDVHNGWLNSRALQAFGARPAEGPIEENEWFEICARLDELPADPSLLDRAYREAAADAAARGVVGIVDMEFGRGFADWPARTAAGIDQLRVRPAAYADRLDEVIGAGLRDGQVLDDAGLVTMGPLKIISDGSLNTRTAYCCDPYAAGAGDHARGKQNFDAAELTHLLRRAHEHGLRVAVHAIGDAAAAVALDAFERTGARGTIEHAQLVRREDLARMAALGVTASVQPAHLLDDRELTEQIWADREDRCFLLRSMHEAGVALALGSDAPVAALDPWLAMAAAVHRGKPGDEPWRPAEAISSTLALASSTDGQATLAVGGRGDVVLLDAEPLAAASDTAGASMALRNMSVTATVMAGRLTYCGL
ncbi:MAG: amidohydrolase family protein [Nocardioides sp.]|nr:amidohydrolase family protein [Nocardioides sp.]